jgi:hypothetical protein
LLSETLLSEQHLQQLQQLFTCLLETSDFTVSLHLSPQQPQEQFDPQPVKEKTKTPNIQNVEKENDLFAIIQTL